MFLPPETLGAARQERYGYCPEEPDGAPFTTTRCAFPIDVRVWDEETDRINLVQMQCSSRPSKGPAGLYCRRHAKIVREQIIEVF